MRRSPLYVPAHLLGTPDPLELPANLIPTLFLDKPIQGRRQIIVVEQDGTRHYGDGGRDDGTPPFAIPGDDETTYAEMVYMALGIHEQHAGQRNHPRLTSKEYENGVRSVWDERWRQKTRKSTFGFGGSIVRTD